MQVLAELAPSAEHIPSTNASSISPGYGTISPALSAGTKPPCSNGRGCRYAWALPKRRRLRRSQTGSRDIGKNAGGTHLTGSSRRSKALEMTPVAQVWGIGRQFALKLDHEGARTALDLSRLSDGWGPERNGRAGTADSSGAPGGRLHRVRGYAPAQTEHHGFAFLRPSGDRTGRYCRCDNRLRDRCGRSIRTANRLSSSVHVFIETNRLRKDPPYAPSQLEALSPRPITPGISSEPRSSA